MSGLILTQFKRKITGLNLVPDAGGCFEITADGELIFSKLKTEEFPDEEQVLADLGRRLG